MHKAALRTLPACISRVNRDHCDARELGFVFDLQAKIGKTPTVHLRKAEEAYRLDLLAKIKEANLLDAEVAKLRAENERLNDLAWRYRGELNQAQEEFAKLKYERLPAIKAALDDLNALFATRNPQ